MSIQTLRITNFRNLTAVDLAPTQKGLNIIFGNNGSGKTSLLEAIYYLALGRSFRSANASRLIRQTTEKLTIFAHFLQENLQIPLGIERNVAGQTRLRLDEKTATSLAEVAACLPLRLINSQSFQLFDAGPLFRRQYIDWGLFYQSENFFAIWRDYERVLKQRNKALRAKQPKKELEVWTKALISQGLALEEARRQYIISITSLLNELSQTLLNLDAAVTISYQSGWKEETDLVQFFAQHSEEEYRQGYTQFGPHRSDLSIKIEGVPVKHFLSRGQQKLLVCAMILAQGRLLTRSVNKGLIYLVDDLPSELDLHSRQKLVTLLTKQQTQVFITAIDSDAICSLITKDVPTKVFHVEQGDILESEVNVNKYK